ncbi:MAG TPA: hypothetical protein VHT72_09925, partial [Puia sp.]|nr:hypothetical protein [Puia sp.]
IHLDIGNKISSTDSQDSVVAKAMHVCHNLMDTRGDVFKGSDFQGFKSGMIDPTSFDLMTASGACGSYSMVLARVLQGYKFDVRIAQMKSNGSFAAHNIVEAKTKHGWVVLDPLYDTYFVNPSKLLASFGEVKDNWTFYKSQVPPGYDMNYRYEDVRYSNWTKIPILLPSVKKILDFTLGKENADTISLRTYFLRKYVLCFDIFLVIFVLVFSYTIRKLIKAKVFPRQNIPVTFSNVYKYLRQRFFEKNFTERGNA